MAQGRKYAALPDLDSAPDVYETQEPADDDDARSATSNRSSSAASSYQDLDEAAAADPAASGVDRAQLQPGDARSHFKPSRVDARRVDFSDRVGGGRRSYKVASSRRRTEFQGVASADDESYDEKLARLKREVEELQALGDKQGSDATPYGKDVVNDLSDVLHGLETSARKPSAAADQHVENGGAPATDSTTAEALAKVAVPDMAQTERALQLAATLEGRLTALESALGLPALSLPHNDKNTPTSRDAADQPVFATLATLDRHLTTLTATTGPTLSSLASQIQSLTASAESLTSARKAATAARKDLRATAQPPSSSRPISSQSFSTSRPSSYARPPAEDGDDAAAADAAALADSAASLLAAAEESDNARRIARLHAALPTVEHLAPLVPAVLERLASLRALHEGAAGAAASLDALEKGQARTAGDVREWRAALGELEGRLVAGREGDARNLEVVKGWVEELRGRMDAVGRAE